MVTGAERAVHLHGLDAFSEKATHVPSARERARLPNRLCLIGTLQDVLPIEHHAFAEKVPATSVKYVHDHVIGAGIDHGSGSPCLLLASDYWVAHDWRPFRLARRRGT